MNPFIVGTLNYRLIRRRLVNILQLVRGTKTKMLSEVISIRSLHWAYVNKCKKPFFTLHFSSLLASRKMCSYVWCVCAMSNEQWACNVWWRPWPNDIHMQLVFRHSFYFNLVQFSAAIQRWRHQTVFIYCKFYRHMPHTTYVCVCVCPQSTAQSTVQLFIIIII